MNENEEQKRARRKAIVEKFLEDNKNFENQENQDIIIPKEMEEEFIESASEDWNYMCYGPFDVGEYGGLDYTFGVEYRRSLDDLKISRCEYALHMLRKNCMDRILDNMFPEYPYNIESISASRGIFDSCNYSDLALDDIADIFYHSKRAISMVRENIDGGYGKQFLKNGDKDIPDEYLVEYYLKAEDLWEIEFAQAYGEYPSDYTPQFFVNAMEKELPPEVREQAANENYEEKNKLFVRQLNDPKNSMVFYKEWSDTDDYYAMYYLISQPDENGITRVLNSIPSPVLFEMFPEGIEQELDGGIKLKDKIALYIQDNPKSGGPDISELLTEIFSTNYAYTNGIDVDIVGERFAECANMFAPKINMDDLGEAVEAHKNVEIEN